MSEGPPTSGSGAQPGAQPAQPAQPEVPAGWYPHPTAPGWEAYWTGTGWGTETRPAQAADATAPTATEGASYTGQPAEGARYGQTEHPTEQLQPATAGQATATPGTGAPPGAAATAAAAAPAAQGTRAPAADRSGSLLPLILCVLGALVAIVGSFLPMGTSDLVDFQDNTPVGQQFGIAVIALAVIGAAIAVWSHLKGNRTWLVVLLGAVIVAIAVYMGLVGVDDLDPDIATPDFGDIDPKIAAEISDATSQTGDDASASTGVFATAIGGLLMVLGGVGLNRESR